jgi:hypothetical protein
MGFDQKSHGHWASGVGHNQVKADGDSMKEMVDIQDKKIRQFILQERMKNPLGINAALLKSKQMQK